MAHIHEHYDHTTSAFIVHDGRVLLLHHKKLDMWLQPGGHIELDEHPLEALRRELQEETGLAQEDLEIVELAADKPPTVTPSVDLPIPFNLNIHPYGGSSHRHIDLSYLIRARTDTLRLEADGAHDIAWFDARELRAKRDQNMLHTNTYEYAMFALKHVSSVQ